MTDIANGNGKGALPTIIGEAARRFPVGGKIRSGIKVLTQAAARNATASKLYEKGVQEGKSFDEIEAEIARAVPELKRPLVPKNVPYFTVRRSDFAMPELANVIVAKYGEDRGDGIKRLYRFPVVFPADAWQAIMPHALMCYGASELKYWSEYSADGRHRCCMTFEKVPLDANGKRALRLFGGRKHVRRKENDGICDPERCPEYQARQCNLTGRFIFLMPGILSINDIELATNSFYSMAAARQTLETIGLLRGGRISGFLDGQTTFVMTKKLHEVAMIGEDGQPKRVPQWLIELEAPLDLTRLLRADDEATRFAEADRAVRVLEASGSTAAPKVTGGVSGAARVPDSHTAEDAEQAIAKTQVLPPAPKSPAETGEALSRVGHENAGQNDRLNGNKALAQLLGVVEGFGVQRDEFERYARHKYGSGWSINANGIKRVLAEVEQFRDNADAFRLRVESELDALA